MVVKWPQEEHSLNILFFKCVCFVCVLKLSFWPIYIYMFFYHCIRILHKKPVPIVRFGWKNNPCNSAIMFSTLSHSYCSTPEVEQKNTERETKWTESCISEHWTAPLCSFKTQKGKNYIHLALGGVRVWVNEHEYLMNRRLAGNQCLWSIFYAELAQCINKVGFCFGRVKVDNNW